MGAIDPVVARQHVKTKSASVETSGQFHSRKMSPLAAQHHRLPPSMGSSAMNLHESSPDEDDDEFFYYKKNDNILRTDNSVRSQANCQGSSDILAPETKSEHRTKAISVSRAHSSQDSLTVSQTLGSTAASATPSATARARNFLSVAIGGFSPLRPVASASCLLSSASSATNLSTLGDGGERKQESSNAKKSANVPVSIPTRASLTHDWRKLRTPGKCRECNALVYFNGRECACCGFVAHKKCLITLVIKCTSILGGHSLPSASPQSVLTTATASKYTRTRAHQRSGGAKMKPIFGQPLDRIDSQQVLDFVKRFIYEIDTRGLTFKGIYRVSSIKSKVDRLCQYYDQNPSNLVDLSSFHPNIIANALKIYLRQLPEPLLTHRLYQDFIDIAKKYSQASSGAASSSSSSSCSSSCSSSSSGSLSAPTSPTSPAASTARGGNSKRSNFCTHKRPEVEKCLLSHQASTASLPIHNTRRPIEQQQKCAAQMAAAPAPAIQQTTRLPAAQPQDATNQAHFIEEMRKIIGSLPSVNREMVAIIMRHLRRVVDISDENQMSAKNLSIIFGPTLLNLENNKSLAIVDNIHQARVVELMITCAYDIFPFTVEEEEEEEAANSYIEPDYSSHVSC